MDFLLTLHSHLRHLIFLMGGIATILALITFLRKGVFTSWMRMAIKSYVYLLTLQVVIGLIHLFGRWSTSGVELRHRLEHAFLMLVMVGVAHYGLKYLRTPGPLGPRNVFLVMLTTLILIVLGIAILPTGRVLLGIS